MLTVPSRGSTRPHVDWRLARITARPGLADVPEVTRAEAQVAVASLRLAARRGGELAVAASGLDAFPARRVVVVDRQGWSRAALSMVDAAMAGLPTSPGGPSPYRRLAGVGYGAVGGVVLGLVGRRLLGQFDAFSAEPTLYLLAPNIVEHERRLALVPADFGLWVAAHEQTHALQFGSAPWLRQHLLERFAIVALDEPGVLDAVRDVASGGSVGSFLAGREARLALEELAATMTLLEGHAEFVAEQVGRRYIPSIDRLRAAFSRPVGTHWLARLLPGTDKNAQYRDGLAFCRAVGMERLRAAYLTPANLPDAGEIAAPADWILRVHGAA